MLNTVVVAAYQPTTGGKQLNVLAPGVSIMSLSDPGSYIDTTFPAASHTTTAWK